MLGGVLLCGVEVEMLPTGAGVGARHARRRPGARELRLHPHLSAGGAEAERDPLERGIARELGALGREDPRAGVEALLAYVAKRRPRPNDDLRDCIEEPLAGAAVGLPHLRLGPFLEHDQRPPSDAAPGMPDLDPRRLGEPTAAGNVDQKPLGPGLLVTCDERILDRNHRAERSLDHISQSPRGRGERGDDRHAGIAIAVEAGDRGAAGLERCEVERREVGELPALVLLRRERQLPRQRGALAAPLGEPTWLGPCGPRTRSGGGRR